MRNLVYIVLFSMLTVGFSGHASAQSLRSINMSGTGSVAVKPDILRITAGVIIHEDEPSAAFRTMSETLVQVADVLTREGVAPIDIQTTGLNLGERHGQDPSRPNAGHVLLGYTASSALTVVVRDLDRAGDIVDLLVSHGANQITGFQFDIADPSPLIEAARNMAIKDALSKTTLYTDAAGVALGDILSIVETHGGVTRPQQISAYEDTVSRRSVPVAGGSLSVSVGVNVITTLE